MPSTKNSLKEKRKRILFDPNMTPKMCQKKFWKVCVYHPMSNCAGAGAQVARPRPGHGPPAFSVSDSGSSSDSCTLNTIGYVRILLYSAHLHTCPERVYAMVHLSMSFVMHTTSIRVHCNVHHNEQVSVWWVRVYRLNAAEQPCVYSLDLQWLIRAMLWAWTLSDHLFKNMNHLLTNLIPLNLLILWLKIVTSVDLRVSTG